MSKIYEAFARRHGDPDLAVDLNEAETQRHANSDSEILKPGLDVPAKLFGADTNRLQSVIDNPYSNLINVDLDEIGTTSSERAPLGHIYTINLDDVRSVSAAIRSAAKNAKTPCIGFSAIGNSRTGTALTRDLAAYEARLQNSDVLLVDVDRIRQAQSRFYDGVTAASSFDNALRSNDVSACVAGSVSVGVDFIQFAGESSATTNTRSFNKATYRPLIDYCKKTYCLSLFDLPADGPGSEAHAISQLLDAVIILCDVGTDATVVNRFVRDLKLAAVRVVGAITIHS